MRSNKLLLVFLTFLVILVVAPAASAKRIRGVDGRWYEVDENALRTHGDRRNSYPHGSDGAAAAVVRSERQRRIHRRHRHFHAYGGDWHQYCRNNWRRDFRC